MKKAYAIFPKTRPISNDLESIVAAEGLRLYPVSLDSFLEQTPDSSVALLLLDRELFTQLKPDRQEHLSNHCRRRNLPVLLSGSLPPTTGAPGPLSWTCGLIRNIDDPTEWSDKIATFKHIGVLEHEVSDLQNKIDARWRENEDDLRSAAQIQQSLLPTNFPALTHFHASCHFHPFEKIGGDLFNLRQVDEETLMAYMLDVSGHGISSAMVSVSVHQSLSLQTGQIVKRIIDTPPYYRLLSPVEVMQALADEYPFERFEMFFTIVYMLINIHTGHIRYCTAGHPPPVLIRKDGSVQRLATGGGLIGLPDTGPFEQGEATLTSGDRLFLYSDGLIDHADDSGECFGEERLLNSLVRNGKTLEKACQAAVDDMYSFRGTLPNQDDVSLLGIEYAKDGIQIKP